MLKIVYIGSSTVLSYIPLRATIESDRPILAVVMQVEHRPAPSNPDFPVRVEGSSPLASLALTHRIPLIEVSGGWSGAVEQLSRLAPDVILVSCFGRKLPDDLVSIPSFGCFNLHPSLLPSFRGPAPVFWQLRAGTEPVGVSLHCVSAQIDAGDIVAQTRVVLTDGLNRQQVYGLLAEAGSELVEATLRAIECGSLRRRTQLDRDATYQGYPTTDDYAVSPSWAARRMYNFICATRTPGVVFPCAVDGLIYPLTEAKSYRQGGGVKSVLEGNNISIKCCDGIVDAVYAAPGT